MNLEPSLVTTLCLVFSLSILIDIKCIYVENLEAKSKVGNRHIIVRHVHLKFKLLKCVVLVLMY
jgi:hypothetical protein